MESITGSMSSSDFIPDDVLIEIFLQLPLISLYLFKSVSKHWLSLITSPSFSIRLRNQRLPIIAPVCGLFLQQCDSSALAPLDVRITASPLGSVITQAGSSFSVLQSCNGLLLCKNIHTSTECLVYNPYTNMSKSIGLPPEGPEPHLYLYCKLNTTFKLAFDPTKSSHYKVVCAKYTDGGYLSQILTYSSEKGKWSISDGREILSNITCFETGVYWNNAIHWIRRDGWNKSPQFHLKLDIDHPMITNMNSTQAIDSVSYEHMLFESRGCLLLLGKKRNHDTEYHVFEMKNEYSGWSMKYSVYLDGIVPRKKMLSSACVVLGEREEDSFMVVEVNGYVFQYKFWSETFSILCNSGSSSSPRSFPFIPSLASV